MKEDRILSCFSFCRLRSIIITLSEKTKTVQSGQHFALRGFLQKALLQGKRKAGSSEGKLSSHAPWQTFWHFVESKTKFSAVAILCFILDKTNETTSLTPPSHCYITVANTCCLCSSLERKAPDMKRLSRPRRSSRRREVRLGRRASREASVILLPGRAKLSNLEPKHRPTWRGRQTKRGSRETRT